jgi:hypothetical protein
VRVIANALEKDKKFSVTAPEPAAVDTFLKTITALGWPGSELAPISHSDR